MQLPTPVDTWSGSRPASRLIGAGHFATLGPCCQQRLGSLPYSRSPMWPISSPCLRSFRSLGSTDTWLKLRECCPTPRSSILAAGTSPFVEARPYLFTPGKQHDRNTCWRYCRSSENPAPVCCHRRDSRSHPVGAARRRGHTCGGSGARGPVLAGRRSWTDGCTTDRRRGGSLAPG